MSKLIDLTNQKFGRLTVLERDKNRKTTGGSYWICQCECGTIKSVKSISLRNGDISSCGCYRQEQLRKAKYQKSEEEMLNKRFGKLVVKQRSERKGNGGELYWICQCDCGKTIEVRGHELRRKDENRTVSCGCYHRSIGAANVLNCLIFEGINFIEEYVFLDLPKSRFDFAIVENDKVVRLVEFDGEQHYHSVDKWGGLELQKQRDAVKNEYALTHNIPLVRIPYWERDNITLDLIMSDTYLVRKSGSPIS